MQKKRTTGLFQEFKSEFLIPAFREAHFAIKSPNRYVREVGGLIQEFYVHARGNKKGDPYTGFTFEFSIGEPGPDDGSSQSFAVRFGYLKTGTDSWYYLDADNYAALGELVQLEIARYALPVFDGVHDSESLAHLKELNSSSEHRNFPARLRDMFPGMGRDFASEYTALWTETVAPLFRAAGFEEGDGILFRVGDEVVQAFGLRHWMTQEQTFLHLEGVLGFHVRSEDRETPPFQMGSPDWFAVSSSYVVTGGSVHFSRYRLGDHTPARMADLLRDDISKHLLPFFDRHREASAVGKTQSMAREYLKNRNKRYETTT